MKDFFQALSFLTILPAGRSLSPGGKELARSMAFYPVVGLLIGFLLTLAWYGFSLFLPRPLALWFVIGLSAVLTGGLHLDGLADTMDGLGAGGTREKKLEVMRDSHIGTFGVMGLILLIGAKYFALDQIQDAYLPQALILAAVMGRNSMVLLCYRSPYARPGQGLARPFTEYLGAREITLSLVSAFAIGLLLMNLKGLGIASGTALFILGYRLFFIRRLGGVTGDILGAAHEITEVLCFILLAVFSGK